MKKQHIVHDDILYMIDEFMSMCVCVCVQRCLCDRQIDGEKRKEARK